MTPYTTHILAGTGAALTVGLAALWVTPHGTLRGTEWTAPVALKPDLDSAPPEAQIEPPDATNVSGFLGTLERPLFSPNRKPPPPPSPSQSAQQPEADPFANIQLQGIYAGTGGHGGIWVRVDGKNRSIPLGAQLGPWTVQSVEGRDVTFTRGAETRSLRLVPSKLANMPTSPTAAAPAPAAPGGAAPVQTDDPVRRQEQEQQEQLRARLQLMNSRRIANGLPPLTELK